MIIDEYEIRRKLRVSTRARSNVVAATIIGAVTSPLIRTIFWRKSPSRLNFPEGLLFIAVLLLRVYSRL